VSSRLVSKTQKLEYIQDYNLICGSVWPWNLVSDINAGVQTEGIWEQGAEQNIWGETGWSDRRAEELHNVLVHFTKHDYDDQVKKVDEKGM
jgi:hypothetical protein